MKSKSPHHIILLLIIMISKRRGLAASSWVVIMSLELARLTALALTWRVLLSTSLYVSQLLCIFQYFSEALSTYLHIMIHTEMYNLSLWFLGLSSDVRVERPSW